MAITDGRADVISQAISELTTPVSKQTLLRLVLAADDGSRDARTLVREVAKQIEASNRKDRREQVRAATDAYIRDQIMPPDRAAQVKHAVESRHYPLMPLNLGGEKIEAADVVKSALVLDDGKVDVVALAEQAETAVVEGRTEARRQKAFKADWVDIDKKTDDEVVALNNYKACCERLAELYAAAGEKHLSPSEAALAADRVGTFQRKIAESGLPVPALNRLMGENVRPGRWAPREEKLEHLAGLIRGAAERTVDPGDVEAYEQQLRDEGVQMPPDFTETYMNKGGAKGGKQ